jgi:hypothetical protein
MMTIIRGIALAVLLAGLAATSHTGGAVSPPTVKNNSIPVPVCPPNDPNACHIDQW